MVPIADVKNVTLKRLKLKKKTLYHLDVYNRLLVSMTTIVTDVRQRQIGTYLANLADICYKIEY